MTADRKRKREIRERMERTGEPYSVARRAIETERVTKQEPKEASDE